MKTIDIIAEALVIIGALNWGLVGLFDFNLVGAVFGGSTPVARVIYVLVGLAAIVQAVQLPAIHRRWCAMATGGAMPPAHA